MLLQVKVLLLSPLESIKFNIEKEKLLGNFALSFSVSLGVLV